MDQTASTVERSDLQGGNGDGDDDDDFKDSSAEIEVNEGDEDSNELTKTLGSLNVSSLKPKNLDYVNTTIAGETTRAALYKDAEDRRERMKDILGKVENQYKSKSAIGHLSERR